MRIPGQDLNSPLEKALLGLKGLKKSKAESESEEVRNAATSSDRVVISDKARTFQQISQLASADLKGRAEQVSALKEAVQSGRYQVDAKASAEGLLRAALFEHKST